MIYTLVLSRPSEECQLHREMSYETASSSSSRFIPPPVLPPFLHLTSQENNDSNRPGGSKLSMKNFTRAFHHIVSPRRFGKVDRLERVAEAMVEDENTVCSTRPSNPMKRRTLGRSASSRLSATSIVPQSTVSRISTLQRSPTTLITSFPSLNVSDIPSRSPTNKSPFSAVLLVEEDAEDEEDDPALELWQTEQLHHARLAKLTRHLGEEIPAELVLSPAVLSHGSLRSSIHSRRGSYHHKRRSLDPSAFRQELAVSVTESAEGVLRKSKSLKMQGDTPLSVTGTTPKTPNTVYTASKDETTMVPTPAQPLGTSLETYSNIPMNILNGDVLHERGSTETYSDSLLSRSPHLSVATSGETSPFPLDASRVPQRSRTLPRRAVTADTSWRVEKLANFFGVNDEDVLAIAHACGKAQKFQSSSNSAAGDLAVGIYAPLADSQLEVEVKVSKPTRFWNGRATTRRIHPDDVRDKLRAMRTS